MTILGRIGLAFMILLIGSVTMCAVNKRAVCGDPDVAPAFERARAEAQPLVDALDGYYAAHAYYPRSIGELVAYHGGMNGFRYEVWSSNRVYKSLDCAGRAREFTGFVAAIPDYERRLEEYRAACVRGYSGFVLKSSPLPTAWQFNRGTVVWAQFASHDARWSVEWCSHQANQHNPAFSDCSHNFLDESLPEDAAPGTPRAHKARSAAARKG